MFTARNAALALALALSVTALPAHAAGPDQPAPPGTAPSFAARATTSEPVAKPTERISTSGPAVALSAQQHARLAAKRATLVQGHPVAPPAAVKPAPVMTIPVTDPANRVKSPPRGAPLTLRPAGTPSAPSAAREGASGRSIPDTRVLETVRAGLGPDAARNAGLSKSGDRVWSAPARTAKKEVRR